MNATSKLNLIKFRFGIIVVELPKKRFLAIRLNAVTSYGGFSGILSFFDANNRSVFYVKKFIFMDYIIFKLYLVNRTKINFWVFFGHLFNQENVKSVPVKYKKKYCLVNGLQDSVSI